MTQKARSSFALVLSRRTRKVARSVRTWGKRDLRPFWQDIVLVDQPEQEIRWDPIFFQNFCQQSVLAKAVSSQLFGS